MENLLNKVLGGAKSVETAATSADSDFAAYTEAPDPSPLPDFTPVAGGATLGSNAPAPTARPYTKWYNVHERYTLADFQVEGLILLAILALVATHLVGASLNRKKARKWIRAHAGTMAQEFALVGFDGIPRVAAGKTGEDLTLALADANAAQGDAVLWEKSLFEFASYATGRVNVAFLDVRLTLVKRFNPFMSIIERILGLAFDGYAAPSDTADLILYPFDGKEASLVPSIPGATELQGKGSNKSAFDGFVWAVVNKESMKKVRDDRYDVSITFTKDNSKLPAWATVMTESAEITDLLLTPDLVQAVEAAGELFEYLIISDQPMDKPKTIDDTTPRKRIILRYRLPSNNDYTPFLPLFTQLVHLSDKLAQSAHFRPEVQRKLKTVREEKIKAIQKADLTEKADERALEREKARKAKRDAELNGMDAKQQKKFLEKEREKEMRKAQKRSVTRA